MERLLPFSKSSKKLSCTFRSWVHNKTVSLRLGDICLSKLYLRQFSTHKIDVIMRGKTLRTTLWCFVILQSREEVWKARKNYRTDLSDICSQFHDHLTHLCFKHAHPKICHSPKVDDGVKHFHQLGPSGPSWS